MQCETAHAQLVDDLSGALTETEADELRRHLDGCPRCRAEADSLAATWQMLGSIAPPAPDSARMRERIAAIVDGFEHGVASAPAAGLRGRLAARFAPHRHPHLMRAAAACALVTIGIAIGHYMTTSASFAPDVAKVSSDKEIAAMRGELRDLREMVTLSLMQQQSASERLKGVSWSGQIDRPSSEVVAALLDTLMHDPNVNVRLATIDALERFASQDVVRRGAIQAVERQMSPLVQIALIDFMVKVNERESIGALRRLSQDPQVNDVVRARAAWGLQQLG
jgi:HEAT repeat protein